MRSASWWGLDRDRQYGKLLFAPPVNRSGYLIKGHDLSRRLLDLIRAKIDGARRHLNARVGGSSPSASAIKPWHDAEDLGTTGPLQRSFGSPLRPCRLRGQRDRDVKSSENFKI
jgi:hypothetical protein